ncbi:uncharacterized protein K452DRAFT_285702 [Aplosporella prunicola CBS 121167]|uniref:Uncharacterized protein n=1 Tax=Aplosporella prunicola CBS 121167 TaxID=1176127 RepID=A0A6A6BHQ1_9PEZI|nr:uncharacterized protein K452DRAFT_285702 [Aplosporella prunicola CBS 121167]KAF2143670.1 hypothetical protein K452DRAFT_285702 [Aplosporella prunicola CBS 121167]
MLCIVEVLCWMAFGSFQRVVGAGGASRSKIATGSNLRSKIRSAHNMARPVSESLKNLGVLEDLRGLVEDWAYSPNPRACWRSAW